jgi:Ni,Fe-hydrogenase III small subunit
LSDEPMVPDLGGMSDEVRTKVKQVLGRSLAIREVDTGSCNGCEVEVNALSNPIYDIERLGIKIVASPRHADLLLVTGPVTRNMEIPLIKTYQSMPRPRLVAAMGVCAISGGMFRESYCCHKGVSEVIPVDVYIPGCPPRPQAIIQGIMEVLDRMEGKRLTDGPPGLLS